MSRTTRTIRAGIVMALTGVSLALAVPAQARTAACTSLTNGVLCTVLANRNGDWAQVQDSYEKTGGGTITARFGHYNRGGTWWDQGAFTQSAGTTRYFSWPAANYGDCLPVVGFMDAGGNRYEVPPVTVC
ncbi:hypothetical protein AB0I68_33140 [Streptomyces sp. NPDC050448]|uniref:hypothetical protein n=1 Tax=Streptomyces sp. NPDC050448 TaxID=3155404 RepID=UPI003424C2A9